MASRFPAGPFRIPDETPVCDRVVILNDLSQEATQDPRVLRLAGAVRERAEAILSTIYLARQRGFDVGSLLDDPAATRQRLLALESLRASQSLPYIDEPEGEEWFQPGGYTSEHGGDCDDTVVLLVALFRILGLEAYPVWITQTGQMINHVTSQVRLGQTWFWADPSIRGAMLGETPYESIGRLKGAEHVVRGGGTHGPSTAGQVVPYGGAVAFPRSSDQMPFDWPGWDNLWSGWPRWLWATHYPYLYAPFEFLQVAPDDHGFYSNRVGPLRVVATTRK